MIRFYVKKPVMIRAVEWDGSKESLSDILLLATETIPHVNIDGATGFGVEPWLEIKTLEGPMKADLGDFIIKGIKGEMYPCKPDIFLGSYEDKGMDPVREIK